MSITTLIYLISVLAKLNIILVIFALFSMGMIILLAFNLIDYNSTNEGKVSSKKLIFKTIRWAATFLFLSVFCPSEKTMYLMLGANVIQKSSIPSKVEALVNKKLDYYLNQEEVSQHDKTRSS